MIENMKELTQLKRLGPEEVAAAVAFLASEDATTSPARRSASAAASGWSDARGAIEKELSSKSSRSPTIC